MLEVNNLTHTFDKKRNVLDDVAFSIKEGEIVAIMGKSGAGKSTLLNIIAGFLTPIKGNIKINNIEIKNLKAREKEKFFRQNVGVVFQKYNLLDSMDIIENIQLPLEFEGIEYKKRIDIAFDKILALGIEDTELMFPKDLSGGQQQRVAVCRAIINNPKLTLADEPTGNLDSENTENVMKILRKINEEFKSTVLIITHDAKIANMADRTIKISDGKVLV